MENCKQLTMNFDDCTIEEYDYSGNKPVKKCDHVVKIKTTKNEFISYCSKCGKFLSVRRRKEGGVKQ